MTVDIGHIERVVTGAWHHVLDVDVVPAEADFFDLGGNSLLAVTLVERIETGLGVQVPLDEFFLDSSLAGLIAQAQRAAEVCDGASADNG